MKHVKPLTGNGLLAGFPSCDLVLAERSVFGIPSALTGETQEQLTELTAKTGDQMKNLFTRFMDDENGFVVSAELVMVATILVIGMVAGLTELSMNINKELEDVGSAIGSVNQSYRYRMAQGSKGGGVGSRFSDLQDAGDGQCDISCNAGPRAESSSF